MKLKTVGAMMLSLATTHSSLGQQIVRTVKPVEVFIAEPSRITNEAAFQSNLIIKKSLNGQPFSIPKTWRLVSAVPDTHNSPQSREYILFFQDTKGAVHTIGLQMSGSVTGSNVITIPAQD